MTSMRVSSTMLRGFGGRGVPVPQHVIPVVCAKLRGTPIGLSFREINVGGFSIICRRLTGGKAIPKGLFFASVGKAFANFAGVISHPSRCVILSTSNGLVKGKGFATA